MDYDPQAFYDGLVRHRLIVPSGVPGVFGRGEVFEEVLERLNELISELAADDGAETMTFPPVISRNTLEKVNYLDASPHLCGAVYSFFGQEKEAKALSQRVHKGEAWGELLGMTDVTLNPAACYPIYPSMAGVVPKGGRLITILGWVFRHEPSSEATRMQSFRVREFIRIGAREEVVEWKDMWLTRGLEFVRSLGLPATSDAASDPFFGRAGEMLAATQKQHSLKFEILVPVISSENPTAVCSFNFHQDHFSSVFDIRTAEGDIANSACLGFGLERMVMALFKTHGFDIERWPQEIRDRFWR